MKILYLHGLGSSGQTTTAKTLQKHLGSIKVISPDIPIHPKQALITLRKISQKLTKDDVIVGTSMGGFYTLMFHGWNRIAINPSLHTSRLLRTMLGQRVPFFLPRADGATHYDVTESLCCEYEAMEASLFLPESGFTAPWGADGDADLPLAFFASNDELVNCKDEYLQHFSRFQDFEGTHRLDPATARNLIIPTIRSLHP